MQKVYSHAPTLQSVSINSTCVHSVAPRQSIGMSVDIAVVNTAIKVIKKIKLLNRKIEMVNEVKENEIRKQN